MEFVFCRRCLILTVFLGLWSWQLSAQISVVPIPKTAVVGANVLLSVSGVTGHIMFFSWHKGESIQENQMLSYVQTATPPQETFPPYEGRVRGFPNCSMEILGVNTNDNGSYTVNIHTMGGHQHIATVTIIVYASSVEQPDRTLQIAVGAAIGAVLGAALIITTAVLLYKKGGKCQRKENGIGGNLFEVPDVSRAPPHQYSNIIPQNHEGINVNNHHFHINKQDKSAAQINTLNPKAPDSTYTDLLFKNQSVYTELKR